MENDLQAGKSPLFSLSASIGEIARRCYLPVKEKGAFRDLIKSLNDFGAFSSKGIEETNSQIVVPESRLNITISDNGKGMSAAETDRLFDRYYRGTNTESKTEGTGLGLAIAKSIIELHGGTISVTGSLGTGTTFLICFPTLIEH